MLRVPTRYVFLKDAFAKHFKYTWILPFCPLNVFLPHISVQIFVKPLNFWDNLDLLYLMTFQVLCWDFYTCSRTCLQPHVPWATFYNLMEASGNVPIFEKGKMPPLAVANPFLFLMTLPNYINLLCVTTF